MRRMLNTGGALFSIAALPILYSGQSKYLTERYTDCFWRWSPSPWRLAYVWLNTVVCGGVVLAARGPSIWRHRHRQHSAAYPEGSCALVPLLLLAMLSSSMSGWLGAHSFYPNPYWALVSLCFALVKLKSFSSFNLTVAKNNLTDMKQLLSGRKAVSHRAFWLMVWLGLVGSVQHAFYSYATNHAALQTAENYWFDAISPTIGWVNCCVSGLLASAVLLTNLLTRSYDVYRFFTPSAPDLPVTYTPLNSPVVDTQPAQPSKTLPCLFIAAFAVLMMVELVATWQGYSQTFVDSIAPEACDQQWALRVPGMIISSFGTFSHGVFTVAKAYQALSTAVGYDRLSVDISLR